MGMRKGHVKVPLEVRFWAKVNKRGPDECWLWTGSKASNGYGRIYVNPGDRAATRVSWEIANDKPWPDGMLACHTCDNPPCVNPAHIFPGTMSDNIVDAVQKGRTKHHSRAVWSHCKRGHEFTPENTRRDSRGWRVCLACKRERNQQRYAKETS